MVHPISIHYMAFLDFNTERTIAGQSAAYTDNGKLDYGSAKAITPFPSVIRKISNLFWKILIEILNKIWGKILFEIKNSKNA